jgi:hypothetical protein
MSQATREAPSLALFFLDVEQFAEPGFLRELVRACEEAEEAELLEACAEFVAGHGVHGCSSFRKRS